MISVSREKVLKILNTIFKKRYCAIGVVASIVASQAIDPGSIPGWRMVFLCFQIYFFHALETENALRRRMRGFPYPFGSNTNGALV